MLEQFEGAFEKDEILDLWIVENIFKVYFFVKKKKWKNNFPKKILKYLKSGLWELAKKTNYFRIAKNH